jgi:hypothetical protein
MGKREGTIPLEGLALGGWMILKWIFKKWDEGMDWIDLGRVSGCCECGNESSGCIKCV